VANAFPQRADTRSRKRSQEGCAPQDQGDRFIVKTTRRRTRVLAVGTAATVFALPAAGSAQAQLLGLPLPNLGTVVQDLGKTVDSLLPTGGLVTTVTGTVGGVVSGVQDSVGGTVDSLVGDVLSGGGGASLPTDTLDQLLATLGISSSGAGGSTGTGGTSGIVGPGVVNGVIDAAAPEPKFKVLSTLRSVHNTGKLRVRVISDEPGIVAVAGAIRPGYKVKKKKSSKKARKSAARKHDRRLIKFPAAILAYRKAGNLTMTIKLGRTARRTLGVSRNGRISFAVIAADVVKNQASMYEKLSLKR
jgi:hypothetical protein